MKGIGKSELKMEGLYSTDKDESRKHHHDCQTDTVMEAVSPENFAPLVSL